MFGPRAGRRKRPPAQHTINFAKDIVYVLRYLDTNGDAPTVRRPK